MPTFNIKSGKGVNLDQLPGELGPGFWSACQNMRFRNGNDERVGGIAQVFNTPSITPYYLVAYPSGSTRYLIEAGTTKVYSDDGTTLTEITKQTTAVAITGISRTANVTTVTTTSAHNLATGNTVQIYGCSGSGAETAFNTASATITVTGATTFTYANPGANQASSGGTPTYIVLVGTASNFTGAIDDKWSGGVFNSVLILNNQIDGMYYWDQAGTGKLRPFAADVNKCKIARPFKYHIFQLGSTVSGTVRLHNVAWSAAADPGSIPSTFTAAAANDAGNVDLPEQGGEIVDGLGMGDLFIIYKRDARYAAQYIEGNTVVYDFTKLPGTDGLWSANCVVNTPKGHVFLTNSLDVKIHQGGVAQSLGEGRVRKWLKDNIDTTYGSRAFLCINEPKCEVWVCIPTTGSSTVNTAGIWNWNDDTWGCRSLSGVTFATSGLLPTSIATDERMVLSTTAPKIGLVDSGTTDFGVAFTSMLERVGITGEDEAHYHTLHRSMPIFNAAAAFTATVYHGSSALPDSTVTYATGVTYTHNTTRWVNAYATSGPCMAWKMETTAAEAITLRTLKLEFTQDGEY